MSDNKFSEKERVDIDKYMVTYGGMSGVIVSKVQKKAYPSMQLIWRYRVKLDQWPGCITFLEENLVKVTNTKRFILED